MITLFIMLHGRLAVKVKVPLQLAESIITKGTRFAFSSREKSVDLTTRVLNYRNKFRFRNFSEKNAKLEPDKLKSTNQIVFEGLQPERHLDTHLN